MGLGFGQKGSCAREKDKASALVLRCTGLLGPGIYGDLYGDFGVLDCRDKLASSHRRAVHLGIAGRKNDQPKPAGVQGPNPKAIWYTKVPGYIAQVCRSGLG